VYGEEAECDTEDTREEKQTQTKASKIPNEIQSKPGIAPPSLSVNESLWTKFPLLYSISIYFHPRYSSVLYMQPQLAVNNIGVVCVGYDFR